MIKYNKQSEKFILSQGKSAALRLHSAIEALPLGDVKRLNGRRTPFLYRLRVGGYRVVFSFEEGVYNIVRIDNRGDIYKKGF